jgi:hypothetical protein
MLAGGAVERDTFRYHARVVEGAHFTSARAKLCGQNQGEHQTAK